MDDESTSAKTAPSDAETGAAPGIDAVNQQILDWLAALSAGDGTGAALYGAAATALASAQATALGMYNMVARQQADAAITSAAVAAMCARMTGASLPPMPPGETQHGLAGAAEAQAAAGVRILVALAVQPGDPSGARAALDRIIEAAAVPSEPEAESPSPGPAKRQGRRSPAASKANA
jgi:hypothetical protein